MICDHLCTNLLVCEILDGVITIIRISHLALHLPNHPSWKLRSPAVHFSSPLPHFLHSVTFTNDIFVPHCLISLHLCHGPVPCLIFTVFCDLFSLLFYSFISPQLLRPFSFFLSFDLSVFHLLVGYCQPLSCEEQKQSPALALFSMVVSQKGIKPTTLSVIQLYSLLLPESSACFCGMLAKFKSSKYDFAFCLL